MLDSYLVKVKGRAEVKKVAEVRSNVPQEKTEAVEKQVKRRTAFI